MSDRFTGSRSGLPESCDQPLRVVDGHGERQISGRGVAVEAVYGAAEPDAQAACAVAGEGQGMTRFPDAHTE